MISSATACIPAALGQKNDATSRQSVKPGDPTVVGTDGMAPAWLRDPHEVGAASVAATCLPPPAWLPT
jgi:hypothetical protein